MCSRRAGTDPAATSLKGSPGSALRKGPLRVGSGRPPPPGPARGPLLTCGPARPAAGHGCVAAAAVAPRTLDGRPGSGRGPGRGWGPRAREGLARRCWRGGLRGLGKGLEQKCFLFQRLPAWPRLHHSLLINRFLLPSSPTGRPLAPRRGCRTRTLPRAAPRPGGSRPSPPPAPGPRPVPPPRASHIRLPEGAGLGLRLLGSHRVRPRATGARARWEAPSDAGTGVGWGRPL